MILGHISPIGAFDPSNGHVFVVDTNSKRFPPHWIDFHAFVPLMCKIDRTCDQPRGKKHGQVTL